MFKIKTVAAALACAVSLAGPVALSHAAFAQGAPEPMQGADPAGSGASDKGMMTKSDMSHKGMSKKTMSKKSMKKHKKAM